MNARRIAGWTGGMAAAGLLAAYVTLQWQKPLLELGVGYGARVACGCRYIGNRPLEDCYKDFEPGMEVIRLSEDPAKKAITAWVPMTVSRTVRYDEMLGCQPEPFSEKDRARASVAKAD